MKPDHSPIKRVSARKYRGAGDVVAAVAQPIARAIDAFANTNIQGCQACMKRRDKLNKIVSFSVLKTKKNKPSLEL